MIPPQAAHQVELDRGEEIHLVAVSEVESGRPRCSALASS